MGEAREESLDSPREHRFGRSDLAFETKAAAPGDVLLDRYRLESVVGIGSYGRVFRAHDLTLGRVVAIKEFVRGDGRSDGFLRELGALFELRHPRVVRCESLFMLGRSRYLVYEFMEGGSFRDYLEAPDFSLDTALLLLAQAAEGVAQAHRTGIVHRDLKPENLLLGHEQGSLVTKVTDFGVSVLHAAASGLEGAGSPAYMAPEQFYEAHDHRVDIYALGVIAYEACCGRRPFVGGVRQVAEGHLHRRPELPAWLPETLRELLESTLSKDPDQRPDGALMLAGRLREVVEKEGARLQGYGWPIRVQTTDRLLTTSDWVMVLRGRTLTRFDRRGRLVESLADVGDVITAGKHYLVNQEDRWTLVTPLGRRVITGIPRGARVSLSLEAVIAYICDAKVTVLDGETYETLDADGSVVHRALFVGPDQHPWLLQQSPSFWSVKTPSGVFTLPEPVVDACAHSEREELIVRSSNVPDHWFAVTQGKIWDFREDAGPFSCDGENFVAAAQDGGLVSLNANMRRVARIRLEGSIAKLSATTGLTAWITQDGFLHSMYSNREGVAKTT